MLRLLHALNPCIGITGLYVFSFSVLGGVGGANLGLILMLAAALPHLFQRWREVRDDQLFMLSAAFSLYLALWSIWGTFGGPFPDSDIWNESRKWLVRGFFSIWLVGFWLATDLRRINHVLALALIGFWVGTLKHADIDDLRAIMHGEERASFGNSAINFGAWSAAAALGLLLHSHRLFQKRHGWIFFAGYLLFSLLFALHFLGVLYSLSRGVWLAAILVIPSTLGLFAIRSDRLSRSALLKVGAIGIGLITAATVSAKGVFLARVVEETETVELALDGNSDMPSTPLGYRFSMYFSFVRHWLEKPFFGWGPGASEKLLSRHEQIADFKHFHNSFFEILIQLGLCGLVLYLLLFHLLFKFARDGHRLARLPLDTYYFLGAGFALSAIVALTNDLLGGRHGAFALALAGGIAYAVGKPQSDLFRNSVNNPSKNNFQ